MGFNASGVSGGQLQVYGTPFSDPAVITDIALFRARFVGPVHTPLPTVDFPAPLGPVLDNLNPPTGAIALKDSLESYNLGDVTNQKMNGGVGWSGPWRTGINPGASEGTGLAEDFARGAVTGFDALDYELTAEQSNADPDPIILGRPALNFAGLTQWDAINSLGAPAGQLGYPDLVKFRAKSDPFGVGLDALWYPNDGMYLDMVGSPGGALTPAAEDGAEIQSGWSLVHLRTKASWGLQPGVKYRIRIRFAGNGRSVIHGNDLEVYLTTTLFDNLPDTGRSIARASVSNPILKTRPQYKIIKNIDINHPQEDLILVFSVSPSSSNFKLNIRCSFVGNLRTRTSQNLVNASFGPLVFEVEIKTPNGEVVFFDDFDTENPPAKDPGLVLETSQGKFVNSGDVFLPWGGEGSWSGPWKIGAEDGVGDDSMESYEIASSSALNRLGGGIGWSGPWKVGRANQDLAFPETEDPAEPLLGSDTIESYALGAVVAVLSNYPSKLIPLSSLNSLVSSLVDSGTNSTVRPPWFQVGGGTEFNTFEGVGLYLLLRPSSNSLLTSADPDEDFGAQIDATYSLDSADVPALVAERFNTVSTFDLLIGTLVRLTLTVGSSPYSPESAYFWARWGSIGTESTKFLSTNQNFMQEVNTLAINTGAAKQPTTLVLLMTVGTSGPQSLNLGAACVTRASKTGRPFLLEILLENVDNGATIFSENFDTSNSVTREPLDGGSAWDGPWVVDP